MSDKKSVENLMSLLTSYLIANPRSSAKKAAKSLGVEKKQVNAILYGMKSMFIPGEGSPPTWSVATVKGTTDSEFTATLAKIELKETTVLQGGMSLNAALGGQPDNEMIRNGELSLEGETALARAEEFQSAGRFEDALEQYRLASKYFLRLGVTAAEEDGDQWPARIDGKSMIPLSASNSSDEGELTKVHGFRSNHGAPTKRTPSLQREVEELVAQFPGITYGELALLIGRSEDEVRNAAKKVRCLIIDDVESDEGDDPSVNERNLELLDVIRNAGTMEFPLSSDGYDELLRRGFIKGVTSVRIGQIFGSWRRACELAGVEAPRAARSSYESKWTDQELAEAVARFLVASEYRGAHHRYDEWRRDTGSDDDTPSSGTLRNRLGPSWKAVRRQGLDILRERWLTAEDRWLADGEAERGLG